MKKQNDEMVKVIFMMNEKLVKDLNRISKRMNWNRSQTARAMLMFGVDVYKDFERIGIVRLSEILTRADMAVKEKLGLPDPVESLTQEDRI